MWASNYIGIDLTLPPPHHVQKVNAALPRADMDIFKNYKIQHPETFNVVL